MKKTTRFGQTRYAKASRAALAWYRRHARDLPWRSKDGEAPDPYRVWLSEVMLQQTTVAVVQNRFTDFICRWPDVARLARARQQTVMAAWAGLGYYARARNLHACARIIVRDYGGEFPRSADELEKLPGIGPYTAAAISAIAFGRRAVVVDANIKRVVARWQAIDLPASSARGAKMIHDTMDGLTPQKRAGDFAQSLMDISAAFCRPRAPLCTDCPLAATCRGRRNPENYPARKSKSVRPVRHGVVLVADDGRGHVLMERRPGRGMLGGMLVFPGSHWADGKRGQTHYELEDNPDALKLLRSAENRTTMNRVVEHVFSHFRVSLTVIRIRLRPADAAASGYTAVTKNRLGGLPTVMRKVAEVAGLSI